MTASVNSAVLCAARGEAPGKAQEPVAARRRNLLRRRIGPEKPILVVFVERHQRGEAPRHARVPRQRAVLRAGELQTQLRLAQQHRQYARHPEDSQLSV